MEVAPRYTRLTLLTLLTWFLLLTWFTLLGGVRAGRMDGWDGLD